MNSTFLNQFVPMNPFIIPIFMAAGTGALANIICAKSIKAYNDGEKRSDSQKLAEKLAFIAGMVFGAIIGYTLYKSRINSAKLIDQMANSLKETAKALTRQDHGLAGQETVNTMYEALKPHSLIPSFDVFTKRFTILGSSDLKKEFFEKIFEKENYSGWAPQVLDATDELGNRLVQLKAIIDSNIYTANLTAIIACKIDQGIDEGSY